MNKASAEHPEKLSKLVGKPESELANMSPKSKAVVEMVKKKVEEVHNQDAEKEAAAKLKKKEVIQKRKKVPGMIDEYGDQRIKNKLIEGWNFFQDLNYGDMALIFNNPYYDFQFKEREELEMYEFNHLQQMNNRTQAKIQMTPEETRKMEFRQQQMSDKTSKKYKELRQIQAKENLRVDIEDAFEFFEKNLNVKPENQIESRKEEKKMKRAFINALIFFSNRYYVNDMGRIKPGKQPYSDLSAYSLREFLRDPTFDYRLFQAIAYEKFFAVSDEIFNSDKDLVNIPDAQKLAKESIGNTIIDKPQDKLGAFKRLFLEGDSQDLMKQQLREPSNYYLVKKYDSDEWNKLQHQKLEELSNTLRLGVLKYYLCKQKYTNHEDLTEEEAHQIENKYGSSESGFIRYLSDIAALPFDKVKKLYEKDLEKRADVVSNLDEYLNELVILKKPEGKKKSKKTQDDLVPTITQLTKNEKKAGFLFQFEDNFSNILRGYTIDQRIFHNLCRKYIIIKMNEAKIWTRQFYSRDLKKIYVVLKPLESAIMQRALGEEYPKQIELGFIDLMSLEPVDEKNRPYRIKDKTFKEIAIRRLEEGVPANEGGEEEKGGGVSIQSSEVRMVANAIKTLRHRDDAKFEGYLKTNQTMSNDMMDSMKQFTSLKCLADKTLSEKPREDMIVKRSEMEGYYIFSSIVRYWHRVFLRMIKSKEKAERDRYGTIAGLIYRLVFRKAFGATNSAFAYLKCCGSCRKKQLQNVWDKIGVEPIAPYSSYNPGLKIWRDYQINERKERSPFRSMDRIKLTSNMLGDSINIFELIRNRILKGLLPLHDMFHMFGEPKLDLFSDFPSIQNYADPPEMAEKKAQIFAMLSGMEDNAEPSDFITKSLSTSTGVNIFSPTELSIEHMQSYFGEKIALYFEFEKYHTQSLLLIGIFGIIVFVIDLVTAFYTGFNTGEDYQFNADSINSKDWSLIIFKLDRLVLSITTTIWSSLYIEYWRRKQQLFAIKFGMLDFQASESKRPGFVGEYVRNLANSAFNVLHYPAWKRLLKIIRSYVLIFFLFLLSVGLSILCLRVRRSLSGDPTSRYPDKNDVYKVYVFPAFLNYAAYKLMAWIYRKIAFIFNRSENHETLTIFEDSLITKLFLFNLVNGFNSYLIIAFYKYSLTNDYNDTGEFLGQCINTKIEYVMQIPCVEEMQGQAWSFFVLTFLENIATLTIPVFKNCFMKKFVGYERKYAWGQIDNQIEKEFGREVYQVTPEIDGALFDYGAVTTQFASLSFFGVIFPLSYAISYFTSSFQLHIDKYYYLNFYRRPIPRPAANIGNWIYVLEAVSFLTIFINAGLVVFTSEGFQEINFIIFTKDRSRVKSIDALAMKMKYFVFLVFILLGIKFLISVLVGSTSKAFNTVMARHQNILHRTISKSKESSAISKSGLPIFPLESNLDTVMHGKKSQVKKDEQTSNAKAAEQNKDPQAEAGGHSVKGEIGYKEEDFKAD